MVKYSLFRQDGSQVGDYDLEQLKDYESENYYVMDGDDRVLVGNFLKREQSKSFDPDKTTFFNKLKFKKPIPERELELDSEENLKELENLFEGNEELNENQNKEEKIEKKDDEVFEFREFKVDKEKTVVQEIDYEILEKNYQDNHPNNSIELLLEKKIQEEKLMRKKEKN